MRRHVVHYCGLCCVVFYLGCGASLMNGPQAVPQWETSNKPSVSTLDLISARLFLSVSVTPFIASWINDLWGRKLCLGAGLVLLKLGAFLNALAKDIGTLIGGRVIHWRSKSIW